MTAVLPNIHSRIYERPAPGALRRSTARHMRICVGAINESHEGFCRAAPFKGSVREGQDEAARMADGRAVWLHDVLSGECWCRPAGGVWREGES